MTVQDYTNWLMLFVSAPQQLTAFHRANLRIIIRGGKLTKEDMPQNPAVLTDPQQDYWKKISRGTMDNVPHPEFLGYQPYNMDEQAAPYDLTNRNLRHLDFVNPDEPLKTWELTRESKKITNESKKNT